MKFWVTKDTPYELIMRGQKAMFIWFGQPPVFFDACDEYKQMHKVLWNEREALSDEAYNEFHADFLRQMPESWQNHVHQNVHKF